MNDYPGSKLHQIGPYIGMIRPSLARRLVGDYSKEGDWVWDPFCGSGVIPLECRLLSRHVIAADINPYACALTRAKLHAPISEDTSFSKLALATRAFEDLTQQSLDKAPQWVKSFFNKRTLKETMVLMSELLRRKQFFNAGCLLSILHHQRPGFLSYPASHLVPYLRNRLYPRDQYPEAYEYRASIPRLQAKIKRVLASPPPPPRAQRFRVLKKSALKKYLPDSTMDAVITSPPYMDALDYARDNRLRLWFLGVSDYKTIKEEEIGKGTTFEQDMAIVLQIMSKVIKPGGACVLVLGDVKHADRKYDVPGIILKLVKTRIREFALEKRMVENVPDDRRTRRNGRATQTETIIVFRRTKGR